MMTNRDNYQYYPPLEVRQAIASSKELLVEISGVAYPVYKVKKKNHTIIVDLVNTGKELNIIKQTKDNESKADKLLEIEDLLKQGLINKKEYDSMRKNILGL